MGIEDRDWYRDHLREKEGYKEKAKTRIPMKELEKLEQAWARGEQELEAERRGQRKPSAIASNETRTLLTWTSVLAFLFLAWFLFKLWRVFYGH